MDEYIKREVAIEDVNSLADFMSVSTSIDMCLGMKSMKSRALSALKDIPAADVRPVVLCRDCKFTKTDEVEDPAIYCKKWDRWEMPPDGFCWFGKKREKS